MVVSIVVSRKMTGDFVTPFAYIGFGYTVRVRLCVTASIHVLTAHGQVVSYCKRGHSDHIDPVAAP